MQGASHKIPTHELSRNIAENITNPSFTSHFIYLSMKKFNNLIWLFLITAGLTLSGCLHIVEEVTVKKNGSGSYKMMLDMSEMKGMMDMLKTMAPDSTATDSSGITVSPSADPGDNSMVQMANEISGVAQSLKSVNGLSNIVEINDTSTFTFGYSFDFANVNALNTALKVINKEKYDSKAEEVFRFKGKNFERLATGDIGEELKRSMLESEEEGAEESMEMIKMFFGDMSYKQIYHFPDRTIKSSTNSLSEISDNGHTLTITIKPFDEDQQAKKVSVATAVKLK